MHCPHDGSLMGRRIYEADIEINECPHCSGLFLNSGELELIQATIERDHSDWPPVQPGAAAYRVQNQLDAAPIHCPNCNTQMVKHEHGFTSQVIVDLCPFCKGAWLDAGELESLEVFFEQNRAKAPNASRLGLLWLGVKSFFEREG